MRGTIGLRNAVPRCVRSGRMSRLVAFTVLGLVASGCDPNGAPEVLALTRWTVGLEWSNAVCAGQSASSSCLACCLDHGGGGGAAFAPSRGCECLSPALHP